MEMNRHFGPKPKEETDGFAELTKAAFCTPQGRQWIAEMLKRTDIPIVGGNISQVESGIRQGKRDIIKQIVLLIGAE